MATFPSPNDPSQGTTFADPGAPYYERVRTRGGPGTERIRAWFRRFLISYILGPILFFAAWLSGMQVVELLYFLFQRLLNKDYIKWLLEATGLATTFQRLGIDIATVIDTILDRIKDLPLDKVAEILLDPVEDAVNRAADLIVDRVFPPYEEVWRYRPGTPTTPTTPWTPYGRKRTITVGSGTGTSPAPGVYRRPTTFTPSGLPGGALAPTPGPGVVPGSAAPMPSWLTPGVAFRVPGSAGPVVTGPGRRGGGDVPFSSPDITRAIDSDLDLISDLTPSPFLPPPLPPSGTE